MDSDTSKFLLMIAVGLLIAAFIIQLPRAKIEVYEAPATPKVPVASVQAVVAVANVSQEKANLAEELYLSDSTFLNKTHDFGHFKTKLVRVGFYAYYDGASKSNKTLFRADIEATSVADVPMNFNSNESFIRYIPNRYNYTGGTFEGADIAPEETRTGYILFKGVPENISGNASIIIGTALSYNTIFDTLTYFPFTYEISLP